MIILSHNFSRSNTGAPNDQKSENFTPGQNISFVWEPEKTTTQKRYLCEKAVEADELKIDVIHSVAHGAVRRGIPVLRLHREILVKTRWRFAPRQWPLISQAKTIFISVVCDTSLFRRGETERSPTQCKRLVVVRRRRGGWENKYCSLNIANTRLTFNRCCVGNSRRCG